MKIGPEEKRSMKRKEKGACSAFEGSSTVGLKSSSIVARVTMDLFEHRYYRLSKTLMTLIGQWPYQSARARRSLPALFGFMVFCQVTPQILALVKYRNDRKIVLECVVSFLFMTACVTRFINFMVNSQKTLTLLNRIRADWKVWAHDREVNVLHEYAEQGKNMTIAYAVAVYSTTFLYLAQPIALKIVDVLLYNGTEPGTFATPIDFYHLDVQKYYFCVYLCLGVGVYICNTNFMASDVMLITYVQHVCGLFAALGHKLEQIGTNDTSIKQEESPFALNTRHMLYVASCIDKHNDAIEYAELIESSYKWSVFVCVIAGMLMEIALMLEILLTLSDPIETIRFVAYVLTVVFHFFIECYIAQMLTDLSIGIHFYMQNSQWYRLSPKTRKLVQLITLRCSVPCQLTAGNFLILSVTVFGQTVKAVMSYLAVARTMQG